MHSDSGTVHSATSQVALEALLESKPASLVVVNFYAEGNEPCQLIASFLSTASKQFERVTFVQVNMTEVQDLANKYVLYGVVAAPTCVFLKNKTVLESFNGSEQTALQALLDKHAPRELEDGSSRRFSLSKGLLQSIWNPEAFQDIDPTCLPPTHLFNDILSQLVVTLNPSTQSRAAKSTSDKPIFEPTLTLYCPVEGGEYIIDATVKELARRTGSQVQVIDITQLAADECGIYWMDSFPALKSSGVSVPENMSTRERLDDLIEQILNSSSPTPDADGASSRCPRLIYLRDFRFLANSAPSFYTALLAVVHKQIRQRLKSGPFIPTAVVLGVSATLDESSPRVKSELIHENWGYVIHSELPNRWDEGGDAQSRRESRMKTQHRSWNSGELLGNMYYNLARTEVFPGVPSYDYKLSFKYSRVGVVVPEKRNLEQERHGREKRRLDINKFHAQMALYVAGGELSTGPPSSREEVDDFTKLCRNKLITLDLLRCLADQAVGAVTLSSYSSQLDKLCEALSSGSRIGVTWDDLGLAWQAQAKMDEERSNWLESSMKPLKEPEPEPESAPEPAKPDTTEPKEESKPAEPEKESESKDKNDTKEPSKDPNQDAKEPSKDTKQDTQEPSKDTKPDTNEPSEEPSKDTKEPPKDTKPDTKEPSEDPKQDTKEPPKDPEQDAKDKDYDEVVERVKGQSLNSYESGMLSHIIKPSQIQTGFDSVHLPVETIQMIRNLVSLPLVCPEAFQTGILKRYNMTGALLFGPPGTGKTHLARAIAKESGSRMIMIKPSDIHNKWVGESEKLIDGLFKLAQRLKPCIIFIDEIDALLGARSNQHASNSSRYHTSTLTQFMQEMDGMIASDVVVIGATNRPFDLDDAVVRRLPCRVMVDLPNTDAREAILRILLKDEQLEEEVDIPAIAKLTERFSGSDLKNLCVMAAYESVKEYAHGKVPWDIQQPMELNDVPPSSIPQASGNAETQGTCQDSGALCLGPENSDAVVPSSDAPTAGESHPAVNEAIPTETTQTRKVSTKHFSRALLHVRASASESQMSIRELHRWNQQFGSGGR